MFFMQACDFVCSIFHDRNSLSRVFLEVFHELCWSSPLQHVRPCRRYCQTSSSSARRGDSLQPSVMFFAPSVQEGPGWTLRKGCTFLGPALLYHKITCWLVRPIKWGFMIGFATLLYMSTVNIHLAHGFLKFCLDICTISGLGKGRFPARWLSQP